MEWKSYSISAFTDRISEHPLTEKDAREWRQEIRDNPDMWLVVRDEPSVFLAVGFTGEEGDTYLIIKET